MSAALAACGSKEAAAEPAAEETEAAEDEAAEEDACLLDTSPRPRAKRQ